MYMQSQVDFIYIKAHGQSNLFQQQTLKHRQCPSLEAEESQCLDWSEQQQVT